MDLSETSEQELLQHLLSRCKLSLEEVQSEMENMRNSRYLKNHSHKIWQGTDGRWRTYLPDPETNGRRLIAKSTLDDLNRFIIDHYRSIEENEYARRFKLKNWYCQWLEYKKLQTRSDMYIRKIASDWDRFYKGSKLAETSVTKMDYDILQEWALRITRDRKLTKKQYYNMTLIIRQTLDYAVQKRIITENPFNKVHVDSKLFQAKKKPLDKTQVFLTNEQPLIEAEAWKDFDKTGSVSCLAIPFAFQTGLRLGEIVALKESDIDGNYIHVQRMEIRQVEQLPDGSWSKQTFVVVDYTKTEAGDREVYLSQTARSILQKIHSSNEQHGYYDDGFLFLGAQGRVHSKSVDYRIRKYCRHIGISEKAMHKIRKTYISTLIDSGLNINAIRKLAGHEDERTTYNNYCFNRMTDAQTEQLLESALNG